MEKDGFHQGGPDTQEFKIGSRQHRIHLRDQENSNNSPPYERTKPQDDQFILGLDFIRSFRHDISSN